MHYVLDGSMRSIDECSVDELVTVRYGTMGYTFAQASTRRPLAIADCHKHNPIVRLDRFATSKTSANAFTSQSRYKEPVADLVSLSMVKSAQRALVLSLHAKLGSEVHIALLSVGGVVAPGKKNLSPENIADKAWELYKQPKEKWAREMEIHE